MAIFENGEKNLLLGLAVGVAGTLLAKEALPPFRDAVRPLLKAGVKGGLALYERGREIVAHANEAVEDIVAEAVMERMMEQAAAQEAAVEAESEAAASEASAAED